MAAADPQVRIQMLERELQWAHLKIQVLEERLRKQRIGFLGPGSETLSDLQLELLADEEPGVTREEVEAESRREPILTPPPRERKPHPGRKPLPEHLPRIEEVIVRARYQARKTCVWKMFWHPDASARAKDRRKRPGQRSRGDRNGGV